MSAAYHEFLASKRKVMPDHGIEVDADRLHPSLFDFQADVVRRSLRQGRTAVFLDTGMGKSRVSLEWARIMAEGRSAMFVVPLSIARQTVREATAIDLELRHVRSPEQMTGPGLYVTNYEMADRFDPADFAAVVLDESSILKNWMGAVRGRLIERWGRVPARLACTATPAPNDETELANHAEFLGAMSRVEMLAAFFVHDDDGWRLKGHAHDAMYSWMTSWAIAARRPSDLGDFDDTPFKLPPLRIHAETVPNTEAPEGLLFATSLGGVGDRSRMRRSTMVARLARAAELLDHDHPAIAWCGLNDEAAGLTPDVDGAVNLTGSLKPEAKAEIIEAFVDGEIRVLVSKPSIAGFGLNFQHANQQVFCGLGDSYEAYYQAIRRSWRFGQANPVDVHIVVSEIEQQIVQNVRRKETEAAGMTDRLVTAMRDAMRDATERGQEAAA